MSKRHKRTDLRVGDEIGDPPYRVTLVRKLAADQWLVADYDRPKPQPWHMAWQFPMSKADLLHLRGRIKTSTDVVHWSDWAGQPDIHIACGSWTTPARGGSFKEDLAAVEPFRADSGQLYAFTKELVTCAACRAKLT